jgi:hypothetical protein
VSALGQLETIIPATFDAASWMLPRTLIVRALNDAAIEPPHGDTIRHSVTSADPNYNGLSGSNVRVTIADDDGSSDLGLTLASAGGDAYVGTEFNARFRITNLGPTLSTGSVLTMAPLALRVRNQCDVHGQWRRRGHLHRCWPRLGRAARSHHPLPRHDNGSTHEHADRHRSAA